MTSLQKKTKFAILTVVLFVTILSNGCSVNRRYGLQKGLFDQRINRGSSFVVATNPNVSGILTRQDCNSIAKMGSQQPIQADSLHEDNDAVSGLLSTNSILDLRQTSYSSENRKFKQKQHETLAEPQVKENLKVKPVKHVPELKSLTLKGNESSLIADPLNQVKDSEDIANRLTTKTDFNAKTAEIEMGDAPRVASRSLSTRRESTHFPTKESPSTTNEDSTVPDLPANSTPSNSTSNSIDQSDSVKFGSLEVVPTPSTEFTENEIQNPSPKSFTGSSTGSYPIEDETVIRPNHHVAQARTSNATSGGDHPRNQHLQFTVENESSEASGQPYYQENGGLRPLEMEIRDRDWNTGFITNRDRTTRAYEMFSQQRDLRLFSSEPDSSAITRYAIPGSNHTIQPTNQNYLDGHRRSTEGQRVAHRTGAANWEPPLTTVESHSVYADLLFGRSFSQPPQPTDINLMATPNSKVTWIPPVVSVAKNQAVLRSEPPDRNSPSDSWQPSNTPPRQKETRPELPMIESIPIERLPPLQPSERYTDRHPAFETAR